MSKYSLHNVILRELKAVRKQRTFIFYFFLFILTISGSLIPFIAIYLSKVIIDGILNNVDTNKLINTIIIICSIGLALKVITSILKNVLHIYFMNTRLKEFDNVNRHYQTIDYKYIEDTTFQDKFEVSHRALESDGDGFMNVLTVISNILNFFSSKKNN